MDLTPASVCLASERLWALQKRKGTCAFASFLCPINGVGLKPGTMPQRKAGPLQPCPFPWPLPLLACFPTLLPLSSETASFLNPCPGTLASASSAGGNMTKGMNCLFPFFRLCVLEGRGFCSVLYILSNWNSASHTEGAQ